MQSTVRSATVALVARVAVIALVPGCALAPPPEEPPTAALAPATVAPSVDLDDRRTEIAHLAAELATARARVREVERELAACKKEHPPRYPICSWASTPVRGVVLGVDDETGVLLLSAGSKDGVRRGDRFVVHRGDTFLAIIQAELVFEDKWSATVSRVGGRPQSEGPIRAGDRFQQLD